MSTLLYGSEVVGGDGTRLVSNGVEGPLRFEGLRLSESDEISPLVGSEGMYVDLMGGVDAEAVERFGVATPDRGESSVSLPSVSVLVTSSAGAAEPVNIFARSSVYRWNQI